MARWDEGAITDIAARRRFHREVMPIWLSTACTLLGGRAPALSGPFRYADLGCGTGFDALTVAATCPAAEVWGFDFNPAHIEAARELAEQAGLTNARFVEASFASLAARPDDELPAFDFMIAQSVLHVVSPENQDHLYRLIGRHLRPGGIAYLGYASDTGWSGFEPVQALMRMLYEAGTDSSDFAASAIFQWLRRMKAGGALFLERNPVAERHLADLLRMPVADMVHEFLNREWHPLAFADVADAMAEVKCDYLGRASLHENFAAMSLPEAVGPLLDASVSLPPAMGPLLDAAASIRIRETMQDIAASTRWRRDIYRRGLAFPPVAEHHRQLGAIAVAALDPDARAAPDGLAPAEDDPALYQPLLEALRDGPLTVARAAGLGKLAGKPIEAAAGAVAMLIAAGNAHPVVPDDMAQAAEATVRRLNDAIIDAIARGEEVGHLVSPLTGTAIETNPLEALTVGALLAGRRADDAEGLIEVVALPMRRSGRAVVRDGKPIEDAAEATAMLREIIARIVQRRVPLLRSLGVLRG
jgi:SAM-dependent methyltransferase